MFIRSVTVACLFAFAALAQVPCKWEAEASQASPAQFSCYRGETLAFQPTFLEYGVTSTNATYTLHYQTNGMGTAYWSTNILQFTPAMDVGASAYTFFIRAATTNGVSYRANGKIKMLGAPGATPNTLPLPVQSIDFGTVSYLNAPWVLPAALANSNNWNTAFGWGNHAGLYRDIAWVPGWADITNKPTTFTPSAHNQSYTTITDSPWALATSLANSNNWNTAFAWGSHAGLYLAVGWQPVWTNIIGLPSTFPPSEHNHGYTAITNAPWLTVQTQQVFTATQLWATNGNSYVTIDGTNVDVWAISTGIATNLWITYDEGFSLTYDGVTYYPPAPSVFPFSDNGDGWIGVVGESYYYMGRGVTWQSFGLGIPTIMFCGAPGAVGVAYLDYTNMTVYVTNHVARLASTNGLVSSAFVDVQKELHRDSATNVIWQSVYSNGWMWLVAYTNYPAN